MNERNEKYLGESEGFHFFETEDGSPTVAIGDLGSEKMHHSGGALSETLYIYGDVVKILDENLWPKRLLNIGLGLGYVELLVAAQTDEVSVLLSYEKEKELSRFFMSWVEGDTRYVPNQFVESYEDILKRFSIHFKVPKKEILWNLKKWKNDKTWRVEGSFSMDDFPCDDMSGIYFDPFSSKTNAELWDESALTRFCLEVPADRCVLASYAFTGNLKRALIGGQFEVVDKRGFKGKRESTLAMKSRGPHPFWQNF